FSVLGVSLDSDQETVRQAFLELVKKYHPDIGGPLASVEKFQEIETAYRKIQEKFAKDRWNVNECLGEYGLYYKEKVPKEEIEEHDIEHTAPQHRQYLSYGGVGSGTPFQREKQYWKHRAATAHASITDYKITNLDPICEKNAVVKREDKKKAKKIKTGLGIERLVEDLIQESMARGEFNNLAGSGKPLPNHSQFNPYVDFVTHKMNQILIDNGFTPAWITLQKEIRHKQSMMWNIMAKERSRLGPLPLSEREADIWARFKTGLADDVNYLNGRINTYNLIVPILQKQLLLYDLEKESERVLNEGHTKMDSEEKQDMADSEEHNNEKQTILNLFSSLFHRQ
ncbi:hypothetical protein AAG570_009963, partial [Ranatra chinensis]